MEQLLFYRYVARIKLCRGLFALHPITSRNLIFLSCLIKVYLAYITPKSYQNISFLLEKLKWSVYTYIGLISVRTVLTI